MTPEERLVVLEGLLAKVRQTANERGVDLPQDLPPGIFRASRAGAAASPLTAFTEATSGTHRPLALVEAPPPMSPQITRSEPDEREQRDDPVASGPLIEFESAFHDEVTADGSPEEIEALVIAKLEAAEEEAAQANGAGAVTATDLTAAPSPSPSLPSPSPSPPPSVPVRSEPAPRPPDQPAISRLAALAPGPPSPLPARSPLSVKPPPLMVPSPSARPERVSNFPPRASAPPSVPLELDDLDGLDFHPPEPLVAPPLPLPIEAVQQHESVAPPTEVRDAMMPPPGRAAPSTPPPPARVAPSMPPPPEHVAPSIPPPLAPPVVSSLPPPPEIVPLSMRSAAIASEAAKVLDGVISRPPVEDADVASTSAPPPAERDLDSQELTPMPGELPFSYRPPPEPPAMVAVPPEVDADDEPASVPESQRQKRAEERPFDDAFDGISEPPPESGEVESQRYAAKAHESMRAGSREAPSADDKPYAAARVPDGDDAAAAAAFDESPTPQPSYDVTAEVRAFGSVDVVERPPPARVEVASFQGRVARGRATFGDLLDAALDLGRPKGPV